MADRRAQTSGRPPGRTGPTPTPPPAPTATGSSAVQDSGPGDPPPVTSGLVYSPAGRRRWPVLLVESCHWCAGAHLHRSPRVPTGGGLITRWCTVTGRRYLIMPVVVRNTGRPRRKQVVRHG